ncbi:MAG: sugar ABC transporter permease [Bacilli bacterium]|nr:sugar ABC transporter permease [Bacilli bacterium]
MESKNNWKAWLYLAPVIILLAVFTFFPIINTFYVSFLKNYDYMRGTSDGFTFDNYLLVLTPVLKSGPGTMFEEVMMTALPNTMLITIITVPLSIIISLLIAIGLNSIKALKKVFQTIFFLPYVTNAIAVGMVFSVIFDANTGIFNAIFNTPLHTWIAPAFGVQGSTVNYWSALFALSFYIIWHSLPYKILIFLGGLQNIDKQYYEAAQIDAAPKWKTTLKVTVPLLSPQILYTLITSFIGAFKEYNSVIGLFGSEGGKFDKTTGPSSMKTMVYFIYEQIGKNQVQYACAAAVFLFLIIMVFTVIQFRVSKKRVHY